MSRQPQQTFLFISQVYIPDHAAGGRHMADAAMEMARRGHRVIVFTANRSIDNPAVLYPLRETIAGVDIQRIPFTSFGKTSLFRRLVGGVSLTLQAIFRGLFIKKIDVIVVGTFPPMVSIAAIILAGVRGVWIKFWMMDINPDQLIALGVIGRNAWPARILEWLNRRALVKASDVVVLDRFMAERVNRKLDVSRKLTVLAPWPHEDQSEALLHRDNPFRKRHHLDWKFVIMYSGNHSPCNPVRTILDIAKRFQGEDRLVFLFVGGGVGKKAIEAANLPNIRSLPYQPREMLRYSLSAADIHLVSIGDPMVGIVHPCKVYDAMALARPILLLGPDDCHVADIFKHADIGWHIHHGDLEEAERVIRGILETPPAVITEKGARAQVFIREKASKSALCEKFCDILERPVDSFQPKQS